MYDIIYISTCSNFVEYLLSTLHFLLYWLFFLLFRDGKQSDSPSHSVSIALSTQEKKKSKSENLVDADPSVLYRCDLFWPLSYLVRVVSSGHSDVSSLLLLPSQLQALHPLRSLCLHSHEIEDIEPVECATEGTEQSEARMELLSVVSSLDEKNSSLDKKMGVGAAGEEGIGVLSDAASSTSNAKSQRKEEYDECHGGC